MARQKNGGKKRGTKNHGPQIWWRNGRAYADLRSYADVGGKLEALTLPGSRWAVIDKELATKLFAAKLAEYEAKRAGRAGVETNRTTTLVKLVAEHLVKKAEAGKTSHSHMLDLEHRLQVAIDYFRKDRDPRTITPDDVRDWDRHLANDGKRGEGTRRHYLNALSGLYGRAVEGRYVPPGYNPVAMLTEKPSGWSGQRDTSFLEVHDAALLLEAARVLDQASKAIGEAGNRAAGVDGIYPLIATFLLTGGRNSGVLGLDVADISFDRGLVFFRPNAHRGLKTKTSHRDVPLWPQLRTILQEWMYGGETPRTQGLLFPANGGGMIGDLRKTLDALGTMCGFEPGEIRTRLLRHTYCSARLQTVERRVRAGRDPEKDPEYEWVDVSRFTVAKEMGHGGNSLVDRIYGHKPRHPHRSEEVEYYVDQHRERLGSRLASVRALA